MRVSDGGREGRRTGRKEGGRGGGGADAELKTKTPHVNVGKKLHLSLESGGPYYKARLHAGCSAGREQLDGPSINRSAVYSLERGYKDVHGKSYPTG